MKINRVNVVVPLVIVLFFGIGCMEGNPLDLPGAYIDLDGGEYTDSDADADSDTDSDTDTDTDTDSDSDTDTDTDADIDSETDIDTATSSDPDPDTGSESDTDDYIDGCPRSILGATGDEPNGYIPVCCIPSAYQSVNIELVFDLLNLHRKANGVVPLTYDYKLEETIQGHMMHMDLHPFFSHYAPIDEPGDIYEPWDRASMCDTLASGENIAWGQQSAYDVMEDWINSPGHNANMLNPGFSRVGIGEYNKNWGQLFR